jgi:hypothetical protein
MAPRCLASGQLAISPAPFVPPHGVRVSVRVRVRVKG